MLELAPGGTYLIFWVERGRLFEGGGWGAYLVGGAYFQPQYDVFNSSEHKL